MTGPWELVRLLGRGGMGEVWLARDPRDGREVALKLLAAHALLRGLEPHQRFAREARLLQELDHPGIVRCLGADLSGPRPWIALEHVEGASLLEHLRAHGPLPARRAAEVGLALAEALEAAHARGVVHRDVKPANVVLDRDGRPRLLDFGLARLFVADGEARLTATGQVVGSPAYLPPEQAEGERGTIGPASDVWGLGATLYHLLTGRAPFDRGEWLATLSAVLTAPLEPPSRATPLDPALEAIVLRCLEREPARRFPTAGALALALRGWLDAPPAARPGRRLGVAGAIVAALAVPTLLALLLLPGRSEPPPVGGGDPAPAASASPILTAGALAARALALEQTGDLEAAQAAVERALALDPRCATAYLARGLLHARRDDLLRALADYERACELDPGLADAHYARGAILTRRDDDRGARAAFERAAELAPDDAGVHLALGKLRRRQGDLPGALASLERSLALQPVAPDAYEVRGAIRFELGELQGALADFERQVELAPDQANGRYNRALVRQALGDLEGAAADLERFLELAPWHPRCGDVRIELARLRARIVGDGR